MICPLYKRSRIGMLNRSRWVPRLRKQSDGEELTTFPKPNLSPEVKDLLAKASGNGNGNAGENSAYPATQNPSIQTLTKKPTQNIRKSQVIGARYTPPLHVLSIGTMVEGTTSLGHQKYEHTTTTSQKLYQ